MSDVELNRIQRYGGTRLIVFAYGVRLLGIATGACACLLSVFGFMSLVSWRERCSEATPISHFRTLAQRPALFAFPWTARDDNPAMNCMCTFWFAVWWNRSR